MDLPEAPASANFIFNLATKKVDSIQFTLRDKDEFALIDRVRALMSEIKAVGSDKPQPIPQPAPQPETPQVFTDSAQQAIDALYGDVPTETWDDATGEIEFTKNGKKYLRVKGGKWKKYGAICWPEAVPFDGWNDWPAGQVFELPQKAIVLMKDKNGNMVPDKVVGFEE